MRSPFVTRSAGVACLLFVLSALTAAAQSPIRISGRVIGPDSAGITGQNVVLHRVTSEGGTLLADTLSGADGTFTLESAESAREGDVFFLASRYEERLYIGPMMRVPLPGDTSYILQVGVPERALAPVGGNTLPPERPAGGATGTSRRWFLLLVPLGGLIGVATWVITRAAGPPEERRLLIRIAQLDNAWHASAGDRASYESSRQRLIDRLHALR